MLLRGRQDGGWSQGVEPGAGERGGAKGVVVTVRQPIRNDRWISNRVAHTRRPGCAPWTWGSCACGQSASPGAKETTQKKKNNVNVISLQWLYELQRIRQLGPFLFPHPLCRGTKFTSKAMRAAMEIAVPSLRGSSIDWLSINLDHRRRNAPAIHSASKFQPCHSITTDEGIFQRIQ